MAHLETVTGIIGITFTLLGISGMKLNDKYGEGWFEQFRDWFNEHIRRHYDTTEGDYEPEWSYQFLDAKNEDDEPITEYYTHKVYNLG